MQKIMNNTMKYLLVFCLAILCIKPAFNQESSISAKYTEFLIGKWKLDTVQINTADIPKEFIPLLKERVVKMQKTAEFIFTEDNIYRTKGIGQNIPGVWRISEEGEYILIKLDTRDVEEKTKIVEISEDRLIMAPTEGESSNSTFTLYKYE